MLRIVRIFTFLQLYMLYAQDRPVLAPEELLQLIPDQVENFRPAGDPRARMVKIGTLSYSLAEKNFARGKQKIKILLFDYNNALIMYSQAMKNMRQPTAYASITQLAGSDESTRLQYSEDLQQEKNICQIFMGINDRFFLSISCENTDSSFLHSLLDKFNFKEFARTPIDGPKFR